MGNDDYKISQTDQLMNNYEGGVQAEPSQHPPSTIPPPISSTLPQQPLNKNSKYIGLTLKQYFRLHENRSQIATIEEEPSEKEVNTPGFGSTQQQKMSRSRQRKKIKTQAAEPFLSFEAKNDSFHRMQPLPSEELPSSKYCVKLPNINERESSKKQSQLNIKGDTKHYAQVYNRPKVNSFSSTLKPANMEHAVVVKEGIREQLQAQSNLNKNHVTLSSFYRLIDKKASIHEQSRRKRNIQHSPVKDRSMEKNTERGSCEMKNRPQKQKLKIEEDPSILKSFMITRLAMGNRQRVASEKDKDVRPHRHH